MQNTYNNLMTQDRTANLLGALALALTDRMTEEAETRAEHGAAAPAALVSIGVDPGLSVTALARTVGLTHSAAVRLIDRLVEDGLAERRAAAGARADGRAVGVCLTRRGAVRRQAILSGRGKVLSDVLAILPAKDQGALTALIETLLGAIPQGREQADHICRLCDESICPAAICPVECAARRAEGR